MPTATRPMPALESSGDPECAVVGRHGAPGEADSRTQELAALVDYALLDDLISLA
jgi:hypothetical protein